jgi:hypothetical protein
MHISAARGAILEELVLHLLAKVGYRTVQADKTEGTRDGHSGLEVKGRGAWHQIDALAAFDRTPAFMYPLRVMVEAKCYSAGSSVGIEVVRNSVGVLKDISENYFAFRPIKGDDPEIQVPRFNYHAAIFSTSGYSSAAQRYAIAHQVFLIQYSRIHVLEPVIQGLLALNPTHLAKKAALPSHKTMTALLREELRQMLTLGEAPVSSQFNILNPAGRRHVRENIVTPLLAINGSYFGMLQGKWPMHLLSRKPLPPAVFARRDDVPCKIYGRNSDRWSFVPVEWNEGDINWFRLDFDIPEEILELVKAVGSDPMALAQVKHEQFSTLDLSGRIGDIYRQVRLRLDEEWFEQYLQKIRKKAP